MGNKQAKNIKKEYNIYILGIENTGKSTFIKQAQIIYDNGFSEKERSNAKDIIIINIINGIQEIIKYMEKNNFQLDNSNNLKKMRFFRDNVILEDNNYDISWKNNIKELWNDGAIQKIWKLINDNEINKNYQILSLDYYINNIDLYFDKNYLPTNEEILKSRQRTTGKLEKEIMVEKNIWKIVDVGGQRSEREKWKNIIQKTETTETTGTEEMMMISPTVSTLKTVPTLARSASNTGQNQATPTTRITKKQKKNTKVILFFVSLIDFDISSADDSKKTKFKLTEDIFKDLLNHLSSNPENIGADDYSFVLCLNKIDLFQKKIIPKLATFKKEFDDYKEKKEEKEEEIIDSTVKYIEERFRKIYFQNIKNPEDNELSIFITCGLDTDLIKKVFEEINKTLFEKSIKNSGAF